MHWARFFLVHMLSITGTLNFIYETKNVKKDRNCISRAKNSMVLMFLGFYFASYFIDLEIKK